VEKKKRIEGDRRNRKNRTGPGRKRKEEGQSSGEKGTSKKLKAAKVKKKVMGKKNRDPEKGEKKANNDIGNGKEKSLPLESWESFGKKREIKEKEKTRHRQEKRAPLEKMGHSQAEKWEKREG